jgi:hypothetical protein
MPQYVVTVGCEWATLCVRDVEVSADDIEAARAAAMQRAAREPDFWFAARDTDGEATPAAILSVERLD